MFDNPEKLFIILLIALFIFGPQKLIGLGGAMGRAIRDFRGAVRDAHEQFSTAVEEAQRTEQAFALEPPALPAPDPIVPAEPASADAIPAAGPATPADTEPAGVPAAEARGSAGIGEDVAEDEGPHSLASEPSSEALQELFQETLQRKG